jgi:hypothetical protein
MGLVLVMGVQQLVGALSIGFLQELLIELLHAW